MPFRTSRTSAPTRSQMLAISLIKEILVANMQLAAYLVISALRTLMTITFSRLRAYGAYKTRSRSAAWQLSVPTMIRSGFMKSLTASPSFKNSGLKITSKIDVQAAAGKLLADDPAHPVGGPHGHGGPNDHVFGARPWRPRYRPRRQRRSRGSAPPSGS